jgi:hypothetical protein
MSETIVLANVTRDKLELARQRIKAEAGMELSGDSGELKHGGYEAAYSFNEAAGELTLLLSKKPRHAPMWAIRRKLLGAVKEFGITERRQS